MLRGIKEALWLHIKGRRLLSGKQYPLVATILVVVTDSRRKTGLRIRV